MKKLLSRSLIKPAEQRGENDGSPPVRAASLPVRQLLPSSPHHSIFTCTNEQCQCTLARLQHQLENLKEEKSQLESLIQMQQQTLRRIDQEGRNSEELAARQLKVQNKLALVLHDEKASMEDKLKGSADAIHSLNEQLTTLRQLLVARNAEAEKMLDELHQLREADIRAREASKEDAVRLAEANAELQSLRKRLTELEEQVVKQEPLMRLGSPGKLASLVTRNTELVGESAEKEASVSSSKRQLTETQAHAEEVVKEKEAELQSLRERFAELKEQAMKSEPLMRLGSPEKLVSLVTRNTELVGELAEREESMAMLKRQLTETQIHAEESAKEKDAEMQRLRERLSDLEELVTKAEPLMRLGSPEKLASLVTRNTELVGELAEKEESVLRLKRQLTETQCQAEEAAKEKDAELQTLRERVAELEEQVTKAEPLMRRSSPGKLASLVTRNVSIAQSTHILLYFANIEKSARELSFLNSRLRAWLYECVCVQEAIKEKNGELQTSRQRLAELEKQASNAEPLMRLGSPEKLASLLTKNDAAKEKDAELESLRSRLAELEQQATKAEPLMLHGSQKLASSKTRSISLHVFHMQSDSLNGMKQDGKDVGVSKSCALSPHATAIDDSDLQASTVGSRKLRDSKEGEHTLQERTLDQENSDKFHHVAQEEADDCAGLIREAQEVEQRLQRQLQHVQCELEKMKKENHTLKETLMNTAQRSVDKERAVLQDRKEYENVVRNLQVATRDTQDCKYLLEMEKERRIAEVTRLRGQLEEAHQKLKEQQLLFDMQQDQDLKQDCSSRGLSASQAEGLRHSILKGTVELEYPKALKCPVAVTSSLPKTNLNRGLAERSSGDVIRLLRMFDTHSADALLKASCSIFYG
ncbi:hypothetical protein Esti_000494 [Eimeria stiedai]